MDDAEYQHWKNGLAQFDVDNELIAMAIMCAFTKPTSWLDVGCGTGAIVRTAQLFGIDAFGIDQIQEDGANFKKVDLTQKVALHRNLATKLNGNGETGSPAGR